MKSEEINLLDSGFVKLIDFMGDDNAAIRAARVSYAGEMKNDERDKKLLFYLMEHGHHSPFEHITFTFHIKTPIFVARQWFRHRIGMSYNEISRRYTSKYAEEFYIPEQVRTQNTQNKQSSDIIKDKEITEEAIKIFKKSYELAYKNYKKLLEMGIAREMARMVLPVGQYTQFYMTTNVRALMHFLNLRADSHAQLEIQEYALAMAKIFKEKCPWTYEAFLKYNYTGDLLGNDSIENN
ncbi:flavin-dependent thymidylate synthase [Tepiditoga spiralis]|uniref:Flavin-dependent thymidylate synthase n=1 Tax=Tepiditoga spiralis TaxID=2108365 RepID=A0A7G1G550_9BACT|nr:FAD-dependent thymidylate synthase [Tepiditoga spiralis]BBE31690.1 flavin-dependent thymidylate synthase [Tepiditoga spiralis]